MKRCLWAGMLGLLVSAAAPTWADFTVVGDALDNEDWCSDEYSHAKILGMHFSNNMDWAVWGARTDGQGNPIDFYDSNLGLYAIRMNDTDAGGDDDQLWPAGCYSVTETYGCSLHGGGGVGYDADASTGATYSYVEMDFGSHWTMEFELPCASDDFAWCIRTDTSNVFYSDNNASVPTYNPAWDHMVAYYITDDPNILSYDPEDRDQHWMLFWEEYAIDTRTPTGRDGNNCPTWNYDTPDTYQDGDDYNDAVFEVTRKTFTHVGSSDAEYATELTHAEILEDLYSPGVAWSAYECRADDESSNIDFDNGWLYAIRVDDHSDLTWDGRDDHQYELRNVYRGSSTSSVQIGYDKNSGGFTSAFTVDFGGGFGEPGFATVGVADGDVLTWRVSAGSTLTSNSVSPNHMVTYVITPDPTIDLANADHWLCFWEENAGTGDDYNDVVVDLRLAPEIADEPVFHTWLLPTGGMLDVRTGGPRYLHILHGGAGRSGNYPLATISEIQTMVSDYTQGDGDPSNDEPYYDEDHIAVRISGFGNGIPDDDKWDGYVRLGADEGDQLLSSSCAYPWKTIWMSSGVSVAGGWMDSFISLWDSTGLPTPHRFHFDTEIFDKIRPLSGDAACLHDEMYDGENDDRVDNESIYGANGLTLAGLTPASWIEDYCGEWGEEWRTWYTGLCFQAVDGAMEAAAYSKIRSQWSNCKSSNYMTSARYDGCDGRTKPYWGVTGSLTYRGVADLQAPVLYPALEDWYEQGENADDASVRHAREAIESCRKSFGGASSYEITPWIAPPRWSWSGGPAVSRDGESRLLALLRSKGICEAVLYNGYPTNTSMSGTNFDRLVDHAWGASLASATPVTINTGTGKQTDATLLKYALEEYYVVNSNSNVVEFDVTFATDFAYGLHGLRVFVEANCLYSSGGDDVTCDVSVYNNDTAAWDWLGQMTIACTNGSYEGQQAYFTACDAYQYIDGSNNAKVRVHYESDAAFCSLTDLVQLVGAGGPIYVDADASAGGDGGTWDTAYQTLQAALATAANLMSEWNTLGSEVDPIEIWVADGTYTPGALATDSFELVDGLRVYGGFDGTEIKLSERDPATNVTILSGDLGGGVYANNVVTIADCGDLTLLEGFIISDGAATASPNQGGGLYISGSTGSPTIQNCTFESNYGVFGGGVYIVGSSVTPVISNCVFTDNEGTYGGGLSINGGAVILDCAFEGNGAGNGGAVEIVSGSPVIQDCLFDSNTATNQGGGLRSRAAASPSVFNSLFVENEAFTWPSNSGGAMYVDGEATIANCTFAKNIAKGYGGAITVGDTGVATIANCILSDDEATIGPEVHEESGGVATVSYCDIEGGWTDDGEENIDSDPLFTDADNGDYTLMSNSPCIDVADNSSVPAGCDADLAGEDRIVDGDRDMTAVVDMGCYEYVGGDCNANNIPDAYEWSVRYVDASVSGGDDNGSSWANAYADLQDALAEADSDCTIAWIWVASGAYAPGAVATDTFLLVDGVRVYGGFDGAETTLAERDIATNVTTLSGDLGSSVYSQHVVTIDDCGADTLLDGFTITDGVATGLYAGAGLYVSGGAPVVANCIITGNSSANVGGGVYVGNADAAFVDCTITTNTATNGGGGLYSTTGDISLTDCVIDANTATNGGGVYAASGEITASRCAVTDNSASSNGGGAYALGGGAFADCLFAGNSAASGAAGGLIGAGAFTIVGCTFADNSASSGGGGLYYVDDSNGMTLTNCIVYGNTAASLAQIWDYFSTVAVTYSDIENATVWPGDGNDNSDPLFTDDTNGDYTLTLNSPCVDAGYNTNVPEDSDTDLAGEDRIVDGDGDTTETVDMGCYEYQPS